MRYPSNVAYRNNIRTAPNGGFQNPSGRNSAAGRTASYRGPNVRPIGARANDNPLFRTQKPVIRTMGRKVANKGYARAAEHLARGRFIAGAAIRGVPLGFAASAAWELLDNVPMVVPDGPPELSYNIPVPPGYPEAYWVFSGPFFYPEEAPRYQGPTIHANNTTYHEKITSQAQFGRTDGIISLARSRQPKFGLWIQNLEGSPAVMRTAHHFSGTLHPRRGFNQHYPAQDISMSRIQKYKTILAPHIPVNPWVAPLTIPSINYPFPDPLFAVRTGRVRRFREETDSGPSPSSRGQQKKHKSSRPPRGTKEKKLIAAISGRSALGQVVSGIGEGIEYIDILAGAVDFNYRITDGTVGSSEVPDQLWRLQKQKWARQRANGERLTKLTPQEKAKFVYDYWNYIDWNKAATGFLLNGIEDKIFGAIGQQGAKANRRSNKIVGYQFGYAL